MTALTLSLLGRPQILLDGEPVDLTSQKAQALFFHLTVTGHVHSRQELAGLLWSDIGEDAARRNLRVELLKLRQKLDDYLDVSRDRIGLNKQSRFTLDVARFEACLSQPEPTFEALQEAVELYRGEFLEDFHVRDASLFEEWVTTERERLWQMARQAMLRLVEYYIQQREFQRGMSCVDTLLKVEPWLEEAHQQRMRILALSGQRTAALAHYETASAILNDEFGVPPSDETNALYDQIESGELGPEGSPLAPRALAGPAVPLPPPFQAPADPLHFVGRSLEVEALAARLIEADATAVAIIGMGGVGKTTLAAHLAHRLRDHFVDGVLWAYIAGSDPLDILGSWAQALGYDFSSLSDVENRAAALRGVLADKQMLFVLDDVRSAARVRPLFVGGPNSATLLTTRDLDVAMALDAEAHQLAEMTLADGEQLLTRVLGEERVHAEMDAAREICTLLQNLPLAVEIAAQRLRSRPRRRLQDMAERLRNMQERLALSISDRAVRTSFLVSWESLDQEQQRIFALLGVFAGRSFAAPAVAAIADLDLYIAEDRLFTLTALSLLNEEEAEDGPADRYRQHPLLADFAQEQLGADRDVRLRMVEYYLTFAREYQTDYAALQPEWGNLVAGLRCAHEQQEWPVVLAYANTLTEPWFTRARFTEAREAYTLVREAAEALGDERALAECLLRWGRACVEQNDGEETVTILEDAIQLFTNLQNKHGQAEAQYLLARWHVEQGNYGVAESLLHSCEKLRETLADSIGLATTHYQQAFLAYLQGDYSSSDKLQNQILVIQESAGDRLGAIRTLRLLIDIALANKEHRIAEGFCRQALGICHQLQEQSELAATLYSSAVVSRRLGNLQRAQELVEQSIPLLQRMGDRKFHGLALYELSVIKEALQEYDVALETAQQGLVLIEQLQDTYNLVYFLLHLGDLYQHFEELEQTKIHWTRAFDLAQAQNHPMKERLQTTLQNLSNTSD